MNEHADRVFNELWSIYPQKGKARTVGSKANSKRKVSQTPNSEVPQPAFEGIAARATEARAAQH